MLGPDGLLAVRGGAAVAVGIAAAAGVVATLGWRYAPATGWIVAATVYLVWTWLAVGRLDPQDTASHATREDPTRLMTEVLVVSASMASLVGVGYLLASASAKGGQAEIAAGIGITIVVTAWFVVHTVFTLRYARLYYLNDGGIDFNQGDDPPAYVDFAYLAFTLGMTYQVSDTDLKTRTIRATALRHALLSYVLGAVVLAITVNLVAGLGHPSG
ncbi:MAG: putative rane protein [Mycobacterium sp.]|nr:putative rane protein [Mycobacterium sp.]